MTLLVVLLASGFVLMLCGRLMFGYPPPVVLDSVLNRREQALVAAVADTLFPTDGPIQLSGTEADAVAYFDGYVRRSVPRQRLLMRLLFLFTELSPLLFGPRRRRFTRLSQRDRTRHLQGSTASTLYFRRVTFLSFRTLMTMAYLAHPEVERAMRMQPDIDPFRMGAPNGQPTVSGVRVKARPDLAKAQPQREDDDESARETG